MGGGGGIRIVPYYHASVLRYIVTWHATIELLSLYVALVYQKNRKLC